MELYIQYLTCKLKTWNKQELQLRTVCNKWWNSCMEIFYFIFPSNQTNLRNISHHYFLGGKGKKCDLVGGSIYHHTNENQHDFQGGVADILKMVEQAKMLSWAWILSKYCRIIQQNKHVISLTWNFFNSFWSTPVYSSLIQFAYKQEKSNFD